MVQQLAWEYCVMTQLLIFTDLDGTLLDHHSYSFDAASEALAEIRARDYPLVMTSSKTSAEMQDLQQQLAIASPFISENGAAVYWSEKGCLKSQLFAPPRKQLLATIHALRLEHGYQFTGFADCTTEAIAGMTGLDPESADRAARREFTEPLLWQDSEERFNLFELKLAQSDLRILQGGRFRTVMGQCDKSTALNWLADRYRQQGPCITVALGDSMNDEAMLNNADIAVVIHSAHSSKLRVTRPDWILHTRSPGPEGWQQAMTKILQKYQ
jgi:mannosyl-3-phosphoglycerate phosphatase